MQASVHGSVGFVVEIGKDVSRTISEPRRFATQRADAFVQDDPRHGFLRRTVMASGFPTLRARTPGAADPMQRVSPGGASAATPVAGADGTVVNTGWDKDGGGAASGTAVAVALPSLDSHPASRCDGSVMCIVRAPRTTAYSPAGSGSVEQRASTGAQSDAQRWLMSSGPRNESWLFTTRRLPARSTVHVPIRAVAH